MILDDSDVLTNFTQQIIFKFQMEILNIKIYFSSLERKRNMEKDLRFKNLFRCTKCH